MGERNPIVTAYQGGVGEKGENSPEERLLARRAVARHALADDAPPEVTRGLLAMLGLDNPRAQPVPVAAPKREPVKSLSRNTGRCKECGRRTTRRRSSDATARYGARGLCDTCYARERRAALPKVPRKIHAPRRTTVPADPVREHIRVLHEEAGRSFRGIAIDAMVSPTTVRLLLVGRADGTTWTRIARDKAERILALPLGVSA